MKLNPIFESSARRRMRMGKTAAVITLYLAVLVVLAAVQMSRFMGQGVGVSAMRQGIECYIWMTALQFLLIVLVAPALSAGSIAGERERQTFDLLLVTGIGPGRIILGKWMEQFAFLALLIISSVPTMAVVLVTGGVSLADVLMTCLYLCVIALAALSVGMVATVIFRRTLVAVIAAYLMIFAIGAGTWVLARVGPLAASYTTESMRVLANGSDLQVIASLPVPILLNPAVGLVMLLAGQTSILHRTMESTMRLYHIYSVSKMTGFTPVAYTVLAGLCLASVLLITLSVLLLHMQTGASKKRGR